MKARLLHAREQEVVDARGGRVRPLHDHARQHVVNVALPSIQSALGLQISELEWVVTGYALTFGALMLTGGKLADLLRAPR